MRRTLPWLISHLSVLITLHPFTSKRVQTLRYHDQAPAYTLAHTYVHTHLLVLSENVYSPQLSCATPTASPSSWQPGGCVPLVAVG